MGEMVITVSQADQLACVSWLTSCWHFKGTPVLQKDVCCDKVWMQSILFRLWYIVSLEKHTVDSDEPTGKALLRVHLIFSERTMYATN